MNGVPETENDFIRMLADCEDEMRRIAAYVSKFTRMYDESVDGSMTKNHAMSELLKWSESRVVVEARIDDLCTFAEQKGWM